MSLPRGAAVLPANWWEASILSDSCSRVAGSRLIFGGGRRANNAGKGIFGLVLHAGGQSDGSGGDGGEAGCLGFSGEFFPGSSGDEIAGEVFVKGGTNLFIGRFDDESSAFGVRKEKPLEGVRSVIWLESLGDVDTPVGGLMLLDESDEETGEGGAGPVEGMAEMVFAFGVLVAELHAAGLIVAEA